METKEQNRQWHLIRNDNGEWISDEYAVILQPWDAVFLKARAGRQKKPLNIQRNGGLSWCYKHEYEAIDRSDPEPKFRDLKLNKSENKNIDLDKIFSEYFKRLPKMLGEE
ncbi:MAG: hypothetical protein J6T48_08960 [Bacteroidales bacterium]|nr:hypothetical protein [Bacteroidales bacterium]